MYDQISSYAPPVNGHAVARQSQINVECTRLAEQTELLLKQIAELEQRLSVVLNPEGPQGAIRENPKANSEAIAPHADFLRSRNWLLEQATNQVASILTRLEL